MSGFSALVKYLDSWQAVCVTTNKGPWVKLLTEPHFNRDTVDFASRERNESNPGIKTLLPFLKSITEESDLENFQDLIVALDACYWLHNFNKFIAIRRRSKVRSSRFYAVISCFSEDFMYCVVYMYIFISE